MLRPDQLHSVLATDDIGPVDDAQAVAAIVSSLVDYAGNPDIPVVNVHYDLNVLDAVEDPRLLKQEEQELREYVLSCRRCGLHPYELSLTLLLGLCETRK